MKLNTKYGLDEIVYLPFRIVGIRIEPRGETKYKLIANFTDGNDEYDRLRDGYAVSETNLIISGFDPEDINKKELEE